jgi:4a-hydroxytetrahydrobiopterin dehydratase
LRKEIPVKDFNESMKIAGKIAVIAEEEQHHPDLGIHYSSIEI